MAELMAKEEEDVITADLASILRERPDGPKLVKRRTVEDADKLVASVMQRLAEGFGNERSGLEKQWDRVTTCPLRTCGLPYSAIVF
jgi:hypothetical protein